MSALEKPSAVTLASGNNETDHISIPTTSSQNRPPPLLRHMTLHNISSSVPRHICFFQLANIRQVLTRTPSSAQLYATGHFRRVSAEYACHEAVLSWRWHKDKHASPASQRILRLHRKAVARNQPACHVRNAGTEHALRKVSWLLTTSRLWSCGYDDGRYIWREWLFRSY